MALQRAVRGALEATLSAGRGMLVLDVRLQRGMRGECCTILAQIGALNALFLLKWAYSAQKLLRAMYSASVRFHASFGVKACPAFYTIII